MISSSFIPPLFNRSEDLRLVGSCEPTSVKHRVPQKLMYVLAAASTWVESVTQSIAQEIE